EEIVRGQGGAAAARDVPIGVLLGAPGEEGREVPDPYFGGRGPARHTCTLCGGCMVGCRFDAKNTLDRNYLYLAEQLGAEILTETGGPRRAAIGDAPDGSAGYRVRTAKGTMTAAGVVFAAGAIGTQSLLLGCREAGDLPALSPRLGAEVRVNNEEIQFVT